MIVKKTSILTGKEHEMDLPITQEQLDRWQGGELIQRVFPHLSAGQREFLMSGSTQEEWDAAFGDDDLENEEELDDLLGDFDEGV